MASLLGPSSFRLSILHIDKGQVLLFAISIGDIDARWLMMLAVSICFCVFPSSRPPHVCTVIIYLHFPIATNCGNTPPMLIWLLPRRHPYSLLFAIASWLIPFIRPTYFMFIVTSFSCRRIYTSLSSMCNPCVFYFIAVL